jgi:hypothetical protein
MINVFMIFCIFLLFPVFIYAANISLPYYRSFESDEGDEPNRTLDDGDCRGLDQMKNWDYCDAKVRDDYPARYGSKYIELKCDYIDCDQRFEAYRTHLTFEGAWEPYKQCHMMRYNDGTEYWIGWSNYIPRDYVGERFAHAFFQIGSSSNNFLFMSYGADEKNLRWKVRNYYNGRMHSNILDSDWTDEKGEWTDWVVRAVWYSTDNARAKLEVYMNGVLVYENNGSDNMNPVNGGGTIAFMNYNLGYGPGYSCEEGVKQWDKRHYRATYFDEIRIYEQVGGSGSNNYCSAAPPITSTTPKINTPANGVTDVDTSFTAKFSQYSDHRPDPRNCFSKHQMNIQVAESGGNWSNLVYNSGDVKSLNYHKISGLRKNTTYKMRIRHSSYNSARSEKYWGEWSKIVKFTTGSGSGPTAEEPPNPPTNLKIIKP